MSMGFLFWKISESNGIFILHDTFRIKMFIIKNVPVIHIFVDRMIFECYTIHS